MAMTEQEWLACRDPTPMLQFLKLGIVTLVDDLPTPAARAAIRQFLVGKAVHRKRVLFACACCRRIWLLLKDDRSRRAVEIAERSADGLASDEELATAQAGALEARDAVSVALRGADRAAIHATRVACHAVWEAVLLEIERAIADLAEAEIFGGITSTLSNVKEHQAALLHDIIGNPHRPITIDLAWRTSNVTALAQAIYDDRVFDRLPILADALEDAGCDNADILNHCRQPGVHVRGCWVVDLVLVKE
jgi:hypothetical protein